MKVSGWSYKHKVESIRGCAKKLRLKQDDIKIGTRER